MYIVIRLRVTVYIVELLLGMYNYKVENNFCAMIFYFSIVLDYRIDLAGVFRGYTFFAN